MFAPSRRARLALDAVLDVAWTARPDPVQSRDITERLGVPRRHLEHLLQDLVRAGVLRGVRGPRGGYALARERRRITVGEIVRAAAGGDPDQAPPAIGASALARLVAAPFWTDAEAVVMMRLDAITLEELCAHAVAAGLSPPEAAPTDFAI
jgi:Rrf2 family protein